MMEIRTSATLELPDDNWNWKMGRTQDFREGVRSPIGVSEGILSRKTFKIDALGNGISGIPRTSQCVMKSFFSLGCLTEPPPRSIPSSFELDTKTLLGSCHRYFICCKSCSYFKGFGRRQRRIARRRRRRIRRRIRVKRRRKRRRRRRKIRRKRRRRRRRRRK